MNTLTGIDERPTTDDLARENARLQKLVAELLVRNQQLRQALEYTSRPGAVVGDRR
jgi:hypothetical protein